MTTMNSRLDTISVDDNIMFKYNNDVMRQCFGKEATGDYGQYATQSTGDGCLAWFPKERRWKNGEWHSGSDDVNWKNHIEADGNIIVMEVNEGELAKDNPPLQPAISHGTEPHYAFFKFDGGNYKYVGTFLIDRNASVPRRQIFRRIRKQIDLSMWRDNINPSYVLGGDRGNPVFRDVYIGKSFKKHQEAINNFEKKKSEWETIEKKIEEVCNNFKKANYWAGIKTSEDISKYIKNVNAICDDIFGDAVAESGISLDDIHYPDSLKLFFDISNLGEGHNEIIRSCLLGEATASRVFAIYKLKYFLYGLSEEATDYYLSKINVYIPKDADLTEKHCLLYFWKQCDTKMVDWSAIKFYLFLKETFGRSDNDSTLKCFSEDPLKEICYIPEDDPISVKNQEYDAECEKIVNNDPLLGDYQDYDLDDIRPKKREAVISDSDSGKIIKYVRDPKVAANALRHAGFKCECNPKHPTFIRKKSNIPYTESHHFIPMKYSDLFEVSLDVEANIVSLCSNCHNQIHYGEGAEEIIKMIYKQRKSYLEKAGIFVTEEQVLRMYGF